MSTKAELEQENHALRQRIAELEGGTGEVPGAWMVSPEPTVLPELPRYNIQIEAKRNDGNYGSVAVNFGASGVTAENKDAVLDEANDIFEALFLAFAEKVDRSVAGGFLHVEKTTTPTMPTGIPLPPPPLTTGWTTESPTNSDPFEITQSDIAAHYASTPEGIAMMEQDQKDWGGGAEEEESAEDGFQPFEIPAEILAKYETTSSDDFAL